MGYQRDEVSSLLPDRIEVGLSSIIGVTVIAGQNAALLKKYSGGSLEIVSPLGDTRIWGAGYLIGNSEVVSVSSAGTFYLAATGSTVVAMILRGKTSGT